MEQVLLTVAYLVAAVLFIRSLSGLSGQETAKSGMAYGAVGMLIAVAVTFSSPMIVQYGWVSGALAVGLLIGAFVALRVAMTAMPEMVAILNGLGGLASVLAGFASYLRDDLAGSARAIHLGEVYAAVAIGSLTFIGSLVAAAKARGTITGRPLLMRGRHLLNGLLLAGLVALAIGLQRYPGATGLPLLLGGAALASILGAHLVLAIGGADMPVVVALLNSYSGFTGSAAGFMLGNDLLIVAGALVGTSGIILTSIMCKAMNRSLANVVFGGFGTADVKVRPPDSGQAADARTVNESTVGDAADRLVHARRVVIVPGYGMAVARAQHAVRALVDILRAEGVQVHFAIHPVAGRLPGHMNVLLAEADIPYDIVLEMDEVNPDLPETDVVLVVGANDIVNPSAQTDSTSLIYGMPVIEVWKAKRVLMLKRSRAAGYAGVDNPLFYHDNTWMLFGDAAERISAVVDHLRAAEARRAA